MISRRVCKTTIQAKESKMTCRILKVAIFTVTLIVSGHASSQPGSNPMVPEIKSPVAHYDIDVGVTVTGGEEKPDSRFSWDLRVTDEQYQKALMSTLEKAKIFNQVSVGGDSQYVLHADIVIQQRDSRYIGDMGFVISVKYQLATKDGSNMIFNKELVSACKKTKSDEHWAANRIRGALECATKDNLRQLVKRLTKVHPHWVDRL